MLLRIIRERALLIANVWRTRIPHLHGLKRLLALIKNRHPAHTSAEQSGHRTVIRTDLQQRSVRLKVIPLKQKLSLPGERIQIIQARILLENFPDISLVLF